MEKKKSFTLIELLVVIAIIGVLASIVFVAIGSARAKARDARKIAEFRNIALALNMFYDQYRRMPYNNWCGYLCPQGGFYGACEGSAGYDMSMQELVDAGFLPGIPHSPQGGYCYYNYGAGNSVGALMVTALEAAPDTTTGISPSCRPWGAGINWCSQDSNKTYCLCNTY